MQNKQQPFWPDNSIYFLTGSTFLHYPYFREWKQKQIILNQFKKIRAELGIPVSAYSISINHYHAKFYLEKGIYLSKVKQLIHGGTSFYYKNKYKPKYEEIWQDSKTIIITSEEMNWKVDGYTDGNLLKHKEVNTFQELKENPFSSFKYRAEKYGDEFARNLVRGVIITEEDSEGEVDMGKLQKIKIDLPNRG